MRVWIVAASLVLVSPAAVAQSQDSSRPGLGYVSAHDESVNRSRLDRGPREECLIRKSDHRRVCHTRAEWRIIATQMEPARQSR